VTPEGSFSTSTWQATSALNPQAGTQSEFSVHLDPDHAQPTTCSVGNDCQTVLGNGKTLSGGRHPRFSSDGHWIVAAGTLLHLPSGETRAFDANATEALFAPNGDVIAGETDGSLVRFCRSVR
jgi:hypothetical protein